MSRAGTFAGYLRLTRPLNAFICAASVIVGGIVGGKPYDSFVSSWPNPRLLAAAFSAALVLAGGNALNDVRDAACDRINAPGRPIPRGTVPSAGVFRFAVLLFAAGIALAVPVGPAGTVVAVTATALLVWYDYRLKSVPLAGNAVVAFLGGLAFVYGGLAGGAVPQSLVPAVFAVLFHLGRELIKDAADVHGDRAAGVVTAATVWGPAFAGRLGGFVLAVLAVLTAVPVAVGMFGPVYFALVAFGVWPAVLVTEIACMMAPTPERFARSARILKAAMPFGIAAVLAGFQF